MPYWKGFEYKVRDILRRIFRIPGIERVPLSGRLDEKYFGTKGDLMNFPACVEIKSTTNKESIRIRKEWLDKLIAQARSEQRPPLLIFGFHSAREIYAIVPMREWMHHITGEIANLGFPNK